MNSLDIAIITACHHLEHDGREDDGDHGAGEHDAEGVRDGHVGDGRHGSDDHQGGHDALQQDQQLLTSGPGQQGQIPADRNTNLKPMKQPM